MENTWDPLKNSCEALIVPDLTKPCKLNMIHGASVMGFGTWVNPIGYLGAQGMQDSWCRRPPLERGAWCPQPSLAKGQGHRRRPHRCNAPKKVHIHKPALQHLGEQQCAHRELTTDVLAGIVLMDAPLKRRTNTACCGVVRSNICIGHYRPPRRVPAGSFR